MLHPGGAVGGRAGSLGDGSAHRVPCATWDASARRIDGDGDYELHLHFDAQRMDAALQLHEPANGLWRISVPAGLGRARGDAESERAAVEEQLEPSVQAGASKGTRKAP